MMQEYKNDYFKLNPELTPDEFGMLVNILKSHSQNIDVYEVDGQLYFAVKKIDNYFDYFAEIGFFAYTHDCQNIDEKEFYEIVCDCDLRNDLLEDAE